MLGDTGPQTGQVVGVVAVGPTYDELLASSKKQDILAAKERVEGDDKIRNTSVALDPDGATSRDFTKTTTTNGTAVNIASGAVSDLAGNSNAGIDAGPFEIDSVAPAVTCQSPAPAFIRRSACR